MANRLQTAALDTLEALEGECSDRDGRLLRDLSEVPAHVPEELLLRLFPTVADRAMQLRRAARFRQPKRLKRVS